MEMKTRHSDLFDGTAARQLPLLDDPDPASVSRNGQSREKRPALRMLQKDIYVELHRRRRRAQIAARHLLEQG